MITESEMYWMTRLDPVNCMLCVLILVGIVTMLVFLIAQSILREPNPWDKKDKDVYRKRKTADWMLFKGLPSAAVLTMIFGIALVFTPTTREMAAIKVVPVIANSEAVEKLGNSATTLIDLANAWMEELKPDKIKQNQDKNESSSLR